LSRVSTSNDLIVGTLQGWMLLLCSGQGQRTNGFLCSCTPMSHNRDTSHDIAESASTFLLPHLKRRAPLRHKPSIQRSSPRPSPSLVVSASLSKTLRTDLRLNEAQSGSNSGGRTTYTSWLPIIFPCSLCSLKSRFFLKDQASSFRYDHTSIGRPRKDHARSLLHGRSDQNVRLRHFFAERNFISCY
jgi:hypothetical protein